MEKGKVHIQKGIPFVVGRLTTHSFYTPLLESAYKFRREVLNYMFQKNLIEIVNLESNPIKKFLTRPELEVITSKEDSLRNTKIKIKNIEGEVERLKYFQAKNRCLFLNELSFELNHSRYVSMAYGVLIGCILNLSVLRYQHGVRKGFVMVCLAHIMGQTAIFKKEKMAYDFVYPVYEKYEKEEIDEMVKSKS